VIVSVIIPCFGEGRFLDACIQSVRDQSYPLLEIIVIDDSGLGDSLGRAVTHAEEDPRIHLFQMSSNCGLGTCRNQGLKLATGEWVAFLDGDDLLTATSIEARIAELKRLQNSEKDLSTLSGVFGDWGHIIETGNLRNKVRKPREVKNVDWQSTMGSNQFIVSAPLVNKSRLMDVGGFAENVTAGEDYIAWMKMLRAGGWFAYTKSTVSLYRQKTGSMLRNSAHELMAVTSAIQEQYQADGLNICSGQTQIQQKPSPLRISSFAGMRGDSRNKPLFKDKQTNGSSIPRPSNSRKELALKELLQEAAVKDAFLTKLANMGRNIWQAKNHSSNSKKKVKAELLIAVSTRSELTEAMLTASGDNRQIDLLLPRDVLAGITDAKLKDLENVSFLILDDDCRIPFADYKALLFYRDWGPVFETIRSGFANNFPDIAVMKSCGISALNWKPLGAAKRYRHPKTIKLVQGIADKTTLFSRNVELIGSPILDAFTNETLKSNKKEILVILPTPGENRARSIAKLNSWVEIVTGRLRSAGTNYRVASLDSRLAQDFADFNCSTISYEEMFRYSRVISTFCDELFFLASAGAISTIFELEDNLGGIEFLRQAGVVLCEDSETLEKRIAQISSSSDIASLAPRSDLLTTLGKSNSAKIILDKLDY
jgi:glycosyl transferase family 2